MAKKRPAKEKRSKTTRRERLGLVPKPRKQSAKKRRWNEINSQLCNYERIDLLNFFGGSLKFVIQRKNWDTAHPATRFDAHEVIQHYHAGFDSWNTASLSNPALENTLKRMRLAANANGDKIPPKKAKKKFSELREEIQKHLRRFRSREVRTHGARFYAGELLRAFWQRPVRRKRRSRKEAVTEGATIKQRGPKNAEVKGTS